MKDLRNQYKVYFERLDMYVPVVSRVHGPHHPEFHDVRKVYEQLAAKVQNDEVENLDDEFKQLRLISNNYLVPNDVCETYEAVYKMLEEIDTYYHQ